MPHSLPNRLRPSCRHLFHVSSHPPIQGCEIDIRKAPNIGEILEILKLPDVADIGTNSVIHFVIQLHGRAATRRFVNPVSQSGNATRRLLDSVQLKVSSQLCAEELLDRNRCGNLTIVRQHLPQTTKPFRFLLENTRCFLSDRPHDLCKREVEIHSRRWRPKYSQYFIESRNVRLDG